MKKDTKNLSIEAVKKLKEDKNKAIESNETVKK